jgi:hypothetical protein
MEFIPSSSSLYGDPVLFASKSNGGLRLCVDYQGLNEEIIQNCYSLPLIQETLPTLAKAKVITKLNARHGYNMI